MHAIAICSLLLSIFIPSSDQIVAKGGRGLGGPRDVIAGAEMEAFTDRYIHKTLDDKFYSDPMLTTDVYVDAVEDLLRNDYRVAALDVTYAEFTTIAGKYFVAVHVALPPGMQAPKNQKATFFGRVRNDAGREIWSGESEVQLAQSKNGYYFERSFPFPPQNLIGVFGLAVGGTPVAMKVVPMELEPVAKNARRVSRLLVSNDVFPLPKQQGPLDPFAFGGIKVTPKANRAFRPTDELWLFFESQNPAVNAKGAPALTTKIDIESLSPDAPKKKVRGVETLAQALALKGAPGHFGVGTTIDISRLEPGDYRLRVVVNDKIAPATYELEETIRVVK